MHESQRKDASLSEHKAPEIPAGVRVKDKYVNE